MKDGSWTLTGWPAMPVILTLVATQVLTALVMSLPIAWLVKHLFASEAVRAIFGEHFGYWHVVGLFALWYAARFKVKFQGPSKYRSADESSIAEAKAGRQRVESTILDEADNL